MSSSFGPRRKARAVGRADASDADSDPQASAPIVKKANRPKHRSRISFGPSGGTSMAEGSDEEETSVITPKRGLARKALSNSASQSLRSIPPPDTVPHDDQASLASDSERPSYSKAYLDELRSAQQSRRPESTDTSPNNPSSISRSVDVVAKFGTDVVLHDEADSNRNPLIPTDAEIQEKKARRARLAKMAKYKIDPNGDDASDVDEDARSDGRPASDEDEFLTHRDKILLKDNRATAGKKEVETRLVRDDEDLLEGFDEFTNESGRVEIGERGKADERARIRKEMRDMIDAAQDEDGEDEGDDGDEEERELRDEYEEMQTRKGMESWDAGGDRGKGRRKWRERGGTAGDEEGARTPPKITPILPLDDYVERLRERLKGISDAKGGKHKRLEEIAKEKEALEHRQFHINRLLEEASQKYQKAMEDAKPQKMLNYSLAPNLVMPERGLEDLQNAR